MSKRMQIETLESRRLFAGGLQGTYFNNVDFTGSTFTRTDATVNFAWGTGAPASAIAADTFSAQWTGTVVPTQSETYTFHTVSDDGVRLWVDGKLLINNWTNHAPTENTGQIALVAGRAYDIKLEYFENVRGAVMQLLWSSPTTPKAVIPTSALTPPAVVANGLRATYFNNADFTGASLTRTDSTVNFVWNSGSPASAIGSDTFSARWTGTVTASTSETFTFTTRSDDGVRLWVNHKLLINNWTNHAPTDNTGQIALVAGTAYDIQLEYFENVGGAVVQLSWSSPSTPKAIIPATALAPRTPSLADQLDHAVAFSISATQRTVNEFNATYGPANAPNRFPQFAPPGENWAVVDGAHWAAGFFPATMWELYSLTGNSAWKDNATRWTRGMAPTLTGGRTDDFYGFHDSQLALLAASGDPAAQSAMVMAAQRKVSTYNATVGAMQSKWRASTSGDPRANFGVLLDHIMDLPNVLWAADQLGDATMRQQAIQNALTVAANQFRADGGIYQWVYFEAATGQRISGETYQGYGNETTWSRGQAWAIHGFSELARLTGVPELRNAARRAADYWVAHAPTDGVPYWDFDVPVTSSTPRDSSAAAIAASGLLDLAKQLAGTDGVTAAKYRSAAEKILTSLSSAAYLSENTNSRGTLRHATINYPLNPPIADDSSSMADRYFLQAVSRYQS